MHRRSLSEKLTKLIKNPSHFKRLIQNTHNFRKMHLIRPKPQTKPKTSVVSKGPRSNSLFLKRLDLNFIKHLPSKTSQTNRLRRVKWRSNLKDLRQNLESMNRDVRSLVPTNQPPKDSLVKILGKQRCGPRTHKQYGYASKTTRKTSQSISSKILKPSGWFRQFKENVYQDTQKPHPQKLEQAKTYRHLVKGKSFLIPNHTSKVELNLPDKEKDDDKFDFYRQQGKLTPQSISKSQKKTKVHLLPTKAGVVRQAGFRAVDPEEFVRLPKAGGQTGPVQTQETQESPEGRPGHQEGTGPRRLRRHSQEGEH